MAFGESRIQIHDFTIFVESDTRTVPMEIEPPVPIQPPTLPEVTQKVSNYQTKFKVVHTQAILFLKSMSETVGSDIERR